MFVFFVCVCVCVCVCARGMHPPPGYKLHSRNFEPAYEGKFALFQNVMKQIYHERGFSNEAHHERNQPNKTKVMP